MAGALVITVPIFPVILRRPKPLLAAQFTLPTKTRLDLPLVLGAAVCGAGWGLAGVCPVPALAALASGSPSVIVFVVAMILGQWLVSRFEARYQALKKTHMLLPIALRFVEGCAR